MRFANDQIVPRSDRPLDPFLAHRRVNLPVVTGLFIKRRANTPFRKLSETDDAYPCVSVADLTNGICDLHRTSIAPTTDIQKGSLETPETPFTGSGVNDGKIEMRYTTKMCLAALIGFPAMTTAAYAQDDDKGFYAVARAGVAVSPDQKLDSADLASGSTFDEKTKYKSGVIGELGGGYDFGLVRVEQAGGYMSVKAKGLNEDGFSGEGKNKAMFVALGAYVDIPTGTFIEPYVGGGVGVARVDANLTRTDDLLGTSSSYSGKDWGLLWHVGAGVGVKVAPKVTVEVGGRYTQISGLKFDGINAGQAAVYEPTMRTLSGTLGVRYKF